MSWVAEAPNRNAGEIEALMELKNLDKGEALSESRLEAPSGYHRTVPLMDDLPSDRTGANNTSPSLSISTHLASGPSSMITLTRN